MVKCLRFAIPDSLDEPPQEVGGAVIHLIKGLHLFVLPLFGQFYLSKIVLAFTKEVVTSLILPNSYIRRVLNETRTFRINGTFRLK